jgi:DnaJ-class molecular chaperone
VKIHKGTTRGSFGAPASAPRKREPTYYEILCSPPGSSFEELHTKLKALLVACHPDQAKDYVDLAWRTNKYAIITQAYSVLKNPTQRKEYDARLALQPGACMFCQGKGLRTKQQGFVGRTQQLCERCNGSGRADGGLTAAQLWKGWG